MADNAQKSLSDSSRGVSERTNSLQSTAATSIGSENNDEYLEKDDRFDADMQEFAKSVETWRQTVKESQVAESESANELNQEILETDDSPKTFEEEVDKAKTLLCSLIDSTKEQGKRFGPDSLQHAAFWDDELARFCVWWGEARQHLPQIESELRASTSGGTVDALIQDLHALSDDLAEGRDRNPMLYCILQLTNGDRTRIPLLRRWNTRFDDRIATDRKRNSTANEGTL